MCGRFYLTASPEQLIDTFQLPGLPHYETSYNIPTTLIGLTPILWQTGTRADVMKRIAAPMLDGMSSTLLLV